MSDGVWLAMGGLLLTMTTQIWCFRKLLYHLKRLRHSLPPPGQLHMKRCVLTLDELMQHAAQTLAEKYTQEDSPAHASDKGPSLVILRADTYETASAYQLIVAINSYLIRSRGNAIDFGLIKDLVDRKTRLIEHRIRRWRAMPLLAGVAAVLVAGSLGWFLLPDAPVNDGGDIFTAQLGIWINTLRWVGLSVAFGALLTFAIVGWLHPRASAEQQRRQNELFTLVQTELLPSLSQDMLHNLQLLQGSLASFEQHFAHDVETLQEVLRGHQKMVVSQDRIARALQEVDVTKLAQANANMFQQWSESTASLDQFRQYLAQMNHFVADTTKLGEQVNEFLQRTERIEAVADGIQAALAKNERLHHFIESHFSALEDRSQLITRAVVKVDDVLDKSLGELMEHTQRKIASVRELSTQQENLLLKTYDENEHMFGKLARIDDLHRNFAEYKAQNTVAQQQIIEQLKRLNEGIVKNSGGILKKLFRS